MRENIDHRDHVEFLVAFESLEGHFQNLATGSASRKSGSLAVQLDPDAVQPRLRTEPLEQVSRAAADIQHRGSALAFFGNHRKVAVVVQLFSLIALLAVENLDLRKRSGRHTLVLVGARRIRMNKEEFAHGANSQRTCAISKRALGLERAA